MEQEQIPKEVANLVGTVAERWAYYFGKRVLSAELMKVTSAERTKIKSVSKVIQSKVKDWMENGNDTRSEIKVLQGDLAFARETLKTKASPYYEKLRPINKAISYLDKVVIPIQIEKATGATIVPKLQVSEDVMKYIVKPEK